MDERPNPEAVEQNCSRIGVMTSWGFVEGDFHYPFGQRLSDGLRRAPLAERYLLLTDVNVRWTADGMNSHGAVDFLLINMAQVGLVIPLEERRLPNVA